MEKQDRITEARLEKEFQVTGAALEEARKSITPRLGSQLHEAAKEILDMASNYYEDAKHFKEKGDWASAFGALNYAHGWLDAGARLGVFNVKGGLFTVD